MKSFSPLLLAVGLSLVQPWVQAQLSGSVGPTTSRSAKAAKKVCNILNYGGVASATADNSAALTAAWNACKSGGQVYIPSGSYGLSSWVTLSGGTGVSINLEGVIYRITGANSGGTMISVSGASDFEFYSGNSKGAIQGYGYLLNASKCLATTDVTAGADDTVLPQMVQTQGTISLRSLHQKHD